MCTQQRCGAMDEIRHTRIVKSFTYGGGRGYCASGHPYQSPVFPFCLLSPFLGVSLFLLTFFSPVFCSFLIPSFPLLSPFPNAPQTFAIPSCESDMHLVETMYYVRQVVTSASGMLSHSWLCRVCI